MSGFWKSSGFSRGASMYRRITRRHPHERWLARIGKVAGNKDLCLGHSARLRELREKAQAFPVMTRSPSLWTVFCSISTVGETPAVGGDVVNSICDFACADVINTKNKV
ncbi:hypothetical protein DVH24_007325 [Malus domestica]|uniref:Uncharacterized protein n=1 Tax=Malus domestica TaxID=3750 RepID=A0A498HGD4_MALDO|nr:hypothetical protein DVH24_007325 [Malus domestica]